MIAAVEPPIYVFAMRRLEAIERLGKNADRFREVGVAALYLFGSTARDEAHPDSDIDVFVDIRPGERFSLLDLLELKERLEAVLGTKADVMTRSSLHRVLRDDIQREAVRVF